jgi:hypothetical protein
MNGAEALEQNAPEELRKRLSDRRWRLEHLYWIKSKSGKKILFRLNWAQEILYQSLWYFSLILKVRQLGITTFFCILYLDDTLFSRNRTSAIIAHKLSEAQKIFRDKIRFAWDNLPEWLKDCYDVDTDSKNELVFSLKGSKGKDSSTIYVSTSVRSGTVQNLHITELGYIDRHYPEKSQEIRTGALNAVQVGQFVSIESTADGRDGLFAELVEKAREHERLGRKLTKLDFRFFFFPWWKHSEYVLHDPVVITTELQSYFDDLEVKIGQKITDPQRAWYVKKHQVEGEEMFREYPSTPEEAFLASIEGAYYSTQIAQLLRDRRLTSVPWNPVLPVETWWDLGMDDYTVILFVQMVGGEVHIIDSLYGSGEGLAHYAAQLVMKPYVYSRHILPHDVAVKELGTGKSRLETLRGLGVRPITVCTDLNGRPFLIQDGIEAVRGILPRCYFDETRARRVFDDLQAYRKAWDEKLGQYRSEPVHDDHSHAADAFRYGALMFREQFGTMGDRRGMVVPENDAELGRVA